MWPNPQESEDSVTFSEETLNGKLHFFVQWFFNWLFTLVFLGCKLAIIFYWRNMYYPYYCFIVSLVPHHHHFCFNSLFLTGFYVLYLFYINNGRIIFLLFFIIFTANHLQSIDLWIAKWKNQKIKLRWYCSLDL